MVSATSAPEIGVPSAAWPNVPSEDQYGIGVQACSGIASMARRTLGFIRTVTENRAPPRRQARITLRE